jgi:hypothetical protein
LTELTNAVNGRATRNQIRDLLRKIPNGPTSRALVIADRLIGTRVFGRNGVQTASKTVINRNGVRIDIENPNPGQRPGQIHVQVGNGKWLYDPATGTFPGIPNSSRNILNTPAFQKAVEKALEMLGEG